MKKMILSAMLILAASSNAFAAPGSANSQADSQANSQKVKLDPDLKAALQVIQAAGLLRESFTTEELIKVSKFINSNDSLKKNMGLLADSLKAAGGKDASNEKKARVKRMLRNLVQVATLPDRPSTSTNTAAVDAISGGAKAKIDYKQTYIGLVSGVMADSVKWEDEGAGKAAADNAIELAERVTEILAKNPNKSYQDAMEEGNKETKVDLSKICGVCPC